MHAGARVASHLSNAATGTTTRPFTRSVRNGSWFVTASAYAHGRLIAARAAASARLIVVRSPIAVPHSPDDRRRRLFRASDTRDACRAIVRPEICTMAPAGVERVTRGAGDGEASLRRRSPDQARPLQFPATPTGASLDRQSRAKDKAVPRRPRRVTWHLGKSAVQLDDHVIDPFSMIFAGRLAHTSGPNPWRTTRSFGHLVAPQHADIPGDARATRARSCCGH